jgi:riboflavin synthase
MFTGLIQDVGTIRSVERAGQSVELRIATRLADALAVGDSLAVCGVCLTVTATGQGSVVATAVPETLSRTTLGGLAVGARVNLEPALRAGDRLGGHIVQGHVDGVGVVVERIRRGLSTEVTVEPPQELLRYVVEKGSVAVDGVSLTIAALAARSFTVALIPHTLSATTLDRGVGERVNLEVDILAKYVERMLGPLRRPIDRGAMTEEWLREHGF